MRRAGSVPWAGSGFRARAPTGRRCAFDRSARCLPLVLAYTEAMRRSCLALWSRGRVVSSTGVPDMPRRYIQGIGLVTFLLAPLACGSDDTASQTTDASSSGTAGSSSGAAGSSAGASGDNTGTGGSSGCPVGQFFCVQGCNGGGHCAPLNECATTDVFCPPKVDAAVDDDAKPNEAGTGSKCGATTCGAGQFCCGPPACGICAPDGSGIFCGFTCDGG